ncbi:hypothetical protein [Gilvibacter sp.]|uniref:hypothetical protein n=1 Tax=Gilvibacter sp. TaxID=2729997 RepID=UPI0035BE346A
MNSPLKAKMIIPKNGHALWTKLMQNGSAAQKGISEGDFIAASFAQFSDGTYVFGGIAQGPENEYNYPAFMVFKADGNQVAGWPIDPSDWEDFSVKSISYCIDPDCDQDQYQLEIVEAD